MPLWNDVWLTTLNHIKTHRQLTTITTDDAILTDLLQEASGELVTALNRMPMPYVFTQPYDARGDHIGPYHLDVTDLLSITTLTNGDSSAISSSAYVLESAGYNPKWRVRLKRSAGVSFTYATDWEQAISIAGVYGYVPHYAQNAYTDSGVDGTLADTTTTSLAVGQNAGLFEVGQYIRLDSELMRVTAITDNESPTADTLAITRGELGTTAAAHTDADIEQFNQLWDIRKACREIVVYKYMAKDRIGGTVRVFDANGSIIVDEIDPIVNTVISNHQYGKTRIGVA